MQSLLTKISMAALFAASATASGLPDDNALVVDDVDLALDSTADLLK